ncbi:MAG: hypothetical protein ACI3YS_10200 [Prevotella sp.]
MARKGAMKWNSHSVFATPKHLADRQLKKSTEDTEYTEKDFRRMIKTTPSDFRPQTSDFRLQTSDLRLQTSDFILVEDFVCCLPELQIISCEATS